MPKLTWLKYLLKEKRLVFIRNFIRMASFHRTPFRDLLENILQITENFNAGFTFPTVASVALKRPELIRLIDDFHQEIASHGFKHVKYSYFSPEEQRKDIEKSLKAFKKLGVSIRGFRAPYNVYDNQTPRILDEFNLLWDGGIGYAPQYRKKKIFFRIQLDDHESNFVCIPLSKWSDDALIDRYGLKNDQMVKILKAVIKQTANEHGIVMFDLHPIRIGQPKYVEVLKQILEYGTELNGWFPTVTEAVEEWLKHKEWKDDASFCCLLTGDIDNFAFSDYLRRIF